jgi:ABC-type sugar transport system ATPase subunit
MIIAGPAQAMTMSDLIAVMHKGVLQQFGTPEDVYKRPAKSSSPGLSGVRQMNFLEGDVEGSRFKIGEVALPYRLR